jgi:hypothetical protein
LEAARGYAGRGNATINPNSPASGSLEVLSISSSSQLLLRQRLRLECIQHAPQIIWSRVVGANNYRQLHVGKLKMENLFQFSGFQFLAFPVEFWVQMTTKIFMIFRSPPDLTSDY